MKPDPTRVSIAWQEPTMLQIGKSGLSQGSIEEADRLLKKHYYIKVRALRSALSGAKKEDIFVQLCEKVGAQLVGTRGNTAVIFRPRGYKKKSRDS